MKRILYPLTLVLLSTIVVPSESMQWNSLSKYLTKNNALIAGSCLAAGYAGYKLYHYGQEYLENRIIDEAVDAIQTGLTPVYTLQNMPAHKREEILKKKARLINIRKRIMAQLDRHVNGASALSPQHKETIQEDLKLAKTACKLIDAVRTSNPYEAEYTQASTIDQIIEKNIINSILLVTKPDNECTQKELQQKKAKEIRKAKIVEKLKGKAYTVATKAILSSIVMAAIIANG